MVDQKQEIMEMYRASGFNQMGTDERLEAVQYIILTMNERILFLEKMLEETTT